MNNFTGNRYTQGFHGCIHVVEVIDFEAGISVCEMNKYKKKIIFTIQGHQDKAIDLGQNVVSGLNVDQCPE